MIVFDTPKKKKKKNDIVDTVKKVAATTKKTAKTTVNKTVKSNINEINNNTNNNTNISNPQQKQGVDLSATTIKTSDIGKINNDGYEETNKKYGDYYNDDESKKNLKIYEKDNKFYYKENDGKYNEIVHTTGQSLQAVPTQVKKTTKRTKEVKDKKNDYSIRKDRGIPTIPKFDSKKELNYEPQKKKEEKLSTINQIKLDTAGLSKEDKTKYKKSLLKQEKDKTKEDNYIRKGGAGLKGFIGEINNATNNPDTTIYKQFTKPFSNAERIYESGKLNNEQALEYYKLMNGKKNKVDKINKKIDTFNRFNEDISNGDLGVAGNSIQNMNTQIESLKKQGVATTALSLLGAAAGGAIGLKTGDPIGGAKKGAKIGAKIGYTTGSTPYMYKLEAGNEYKDLIDMGVSHKKAKKVAKTVGTINAAIESGENVVDLISFSGAGKIAEKEIKNATATKMRNKFFDIVDTLGEKKAKEYISEKYGTTVAENIFKTYTKNLISEGLQEGSQETVSVLGERKAAKDEGIARDNSKDLERIQKAGISGMTTAGVTGPVTSTIGNIASYSTTKLGQKIQNPNTSNTNNVNTAQLTKGNTWNTKLQDLTKVSNTVNQIQEQVQQGAMTPQEGNIALQQVQNGTFDENRNLDMIVNQKVQELQQAVQQGMITPEQGTAEMETIKQVAQQQFNEINNQIKQNIVENNKDVVYNEPNEGVIVNDFRGLQEASRNLSKEQHSELYRGDKSGIARIRENINRVLQPRLESIISSNNDNGKSINNGFTEVSNKDFHDIFEVNHSYLKNPDTVTVYGEENYKNNKNYLSEDGLSGFSITKDGDLVSVFNNSGKPGMLFKIKDTVQKNAKTLDCFSSKAQDLPSLYEDAFGFKTAAIMDFNYDIMAEEHGKQYADDFVKKYGEAPVHFMVKTDQNVEVKHFNKNQYDEALNYRNSFVNDEGTSNSSFSNDNLYENKESNEQILRFNDDGTSELVDNKPQILDKMPEEKKGIKKTVNDLIDTKNKVREKFTDHRRIFYDLSRKLKNPTLYHKADAIDSASSIAQYQIGKKQTNLQGKPFKNFVNENGEKVSMGFEKAYDMYKDIPVKSKNEYLVHQLNLDRLSQGTEQFKGFDADESLDTIQTLEKKYPDINKWANNIWQYNKNQLQNMVDAGLVSKKLADEFMKTTPHYVRIQRDVGNIKNAPLKIKNGKIEINNQIQKIKGSELDTLPVKEVTAQYTQDVMRAIKTNQFGQELAKSMSVGSQDSSISAVDESFGINPELIGQDASGNYTFTIFKNGKATVLPINEDMAKALQPRDIRTSKLNPAMHVSNIQRTLLTDKNPYFMLRNAVKDAGDMFLYSKYSMPKNITTYTELFGGRTVGRLYNKVTKNNSAGTAAAWLDLMDSLGGEGNSYFNQGEFTSKKGKVSKVIDKALTPIEKGNAFIESMPRLVEFVNTVRSNGYTLNADGEVVAQQKYTKNGKTPTKSVDEVLNEAMYNAAEVTTNFKRGGTWAKNIDKNGATFFNASVQGASKLGRTFTEAFGDAKNGDFKAAKRLVGRVLVLGVAPAIINNAMHGDDDEYKNLPDYIKDQYYLIKGKDGKWIRIPKGRAVSLLESASRRTIEKSKGGKFGIADYANLIGNQIAPNNPIENNSIAPLLQATSNKSWNGSPIESSYMEKLPKEERYDAKTSEISKWLGKQLGISPKKLDYVIDQYSGVIGDIALPSTTNYAESKKSSGFNALINPLKSQFTVDSTLTNKATQEFYDKLEKAEQKKNSVKATEKDKLSYKMLNSSTKDIAELQKQQREIQNDKNLSDSEKYELNKEIQKQIIKMQKAAIKKSQNVSVYDDYAKVGDTIYYKNSKDEWQKESDTERKRREWSDYGIADYYYYKKQQQEETKQKRAEKASQDSSFASSIGITDDEFEEYKYKANKVEGTKGANGKTVRGSVKSARIRYINSLPLSVDQKQALYNYLYKRK